MLDPRCQIRHAQASRQIRRARPSGQIRRARPNWTNYKYMAKVFKLDMLGPSRLFQMNHGLLNFGVHGWYQLSDLLILT